MADNAGISLRPARGAYSGPSSTRRDPERTVIQAATATSPPQSAVQQSTYCYRARDGSVRRRDVVDLAATDAGKRRRPGKPGLRLSTRPFRELSGLRIHRVL